MTGILSSGIIAIKREAGQRRWEIDQLKGRERERERERERGREKERERENMHKLVGGKIYNLGSC